MASLCLSKAVPNPGKHIARFTRGWVSNSISSRYQAAAAYTTLPLLPRTSLLEPKERLFRPIWRRRMAAQTAAPLVWIDCEVMTSSVLHIIVNLRMLLDANPPKQMTGLDPDKEEIIEIFCLITNSELELIEPEGWGTVIHQPKERLDQMDEWCVQTHGNSGLTAAVIASEVTAEQAADELLAYIKKFITEPRTALLAGNTVHADKAFLRKEPYRKVVDFLHYRILDVSSIKEAAVRWCPRVLGEQPRKKLLHQAKDDILESIEEAKFYRNTIFKGR